MLAITVTALDVAAISALAAVVAPATAWLSAIGGRRHERDRARESRLYSDIRDAYGALLTKLHEYENAMLLSHPREPDPDIETPPALVTLLKKPEWEEELVRASARVAVVGSESVAKAVQDVDEAFGAFWDALARFERLAQGDPSSVEASRDALSQRVRGLEEQMRKDVRR